MKNFFYNKKFFPAAKFLALLSVIIILIATPFAINTKSGRGGLTLNKAYAETAAEAEDRASIAAQKASRAAADARIAAAAAQTRADQSTTYTDDGVAVGKDPALVAVAENAKRLADNAETAHKAASYAAGAATKAANEGDEATAIAAADTAVLRATDAQNYNQQIIGIIANPSSAVTNNGAVNPDPGEEESKNTCWLGITQGGFNWQYCFYLWFGYIAYFIIWLASWILGLAGILMNEVFTYTVVDMSTNIRGITGINIAWQAFRDIANMSFIFILLYIGIKTIIGEGGDSTKKMLRSVIIAAVLINFSLFFTKVIIDASNIITIGFYNGIVNQAGGDPNSLGSGVSNILMSNLGLTTIFDVSSSATALANKGFQYTIIMGIGGSAFILTAAFTFLFAAGLFLIRYAVLIILLLLSPLAYAGQILPSTQGQAKKWWDSLMGQVIFAPAYMLMLWAVIKMVGNGLFKTPTQGFADALAGTESAAGTLGGAGATNMGVIINFIIIIILLNACALIAKTFAGRSGAFVQKAIGKAEGYARRWTTDVNRNVGQAAGRAAAGVASLPLTVGQRAARSSVGYVGKELGKKYDKTEAKLRQSAGFNAVANTLGKVPLTDAIAKSLSRSARGTLKGVEDAKFGTGETYADVRKANLERNKFISSQQREMDTAKKVKDGIAALAVDETTLNDDQKKVRTASIDAMEQAVNKLTDKEIEAFVEEMGADKFASSGIMERVNVRQLQALNKSEKFTEAEKTGFVEARLKPISATIKEADTLRNLGVLNQDQQKKLADLDGDIKKRIRAINDQEMEIVGNKILENKELENQAIKHMTGGQYDGIQKSNAFTRTQKSNVKDAREKPLKEAFEAAEKIHKTIMELPAGTPIPQNLLDSSHDAEQNIGSLLKTMKAGDIAKLDTKILKHDATVAVLTPAMMNKFVDELEPSTLKEIGEKITKQNRAMVAAGGKHAAIDFITKGKTAEFFK